MVMWKVQNENKLQAIHKIKESLESLIPLIRQIQSLEVGVNINTSASAYDIILVSTFANREDLDIYQNHEEHKKVGSFIGSVTSDRRVVDYEV